MKWVWDISEQHPNLEIQQSDFNNELDSAVVVRERARRSTREQTFSKKAGRVINETAHTIAMLPDSSSTPKIPSKRGVAIATNEQEENIEKKVRARAVVSETTSWSENEEPTKTGRLTKKKGNQQSPEIAFDFEEEARPSIIGIGSTGTAVRE